MREKKSDGVNQISLNSTAWRVFTRATLFQAKDKDEMMSWIEIIKKNNDPDKDVSFLKTFQLIPTLNV